jgi:hypothetical protein
MTIERNEMTLDSLPAPGVARASSRAWLRPAVLVALLGLWCLVLGSSTARADFGIEPGSFSVVASNSADPANDWEANPADPATQAGAHPFITTVGFGFNVQPTPNSVGQPIPYEDPKDTKVLLPSGMVGDPTAATVCAERDLEHVGACPSSTQVGTVEIKGTQLFVVATFQVPLFNVAPEPGKPGELGFSFGGIITHISANAKGSDGYRLESESVDLSQILSLYGIHINIWGVPGDPRHDAQRTENCNIPLGGGCVGGNVAFSGQVLPYFSLPTECGASPTSKLSVDSWQQPGRFLDYSAEMPPMTGCDKVAFDPTISVQPKTPRAAGPSGFAIDINVPQSDNPDGLATAHVKDVDMTLPQGVAVSPAAASGLGACTDAQAGVGNDDPVACPDSAKIGTVRIDTPVLADPLNGSLYLGTQQSDDPQSGKMFRMFLVASGSGVTVKLPGAVKVDPVTGQLTTSFVNNPQMPFDKLSLDLFGGPGAALVNPQVCGTATTSATLTSWSGKTATVSDDATFDCVPGLGTFAPAFAAGTLNPVAGATSPFTMQVDKPDVQSDLNGVTLSLPKGLLGKLKNNIGTQIGTAKVASGAGPNPFWLSGPVVLEGPYDDAPFSLRVTIPAIAGPFNLGDVVVRQKIYVDPVDAHVTVVSDPLPTIVKGVPVRLQKLVVDIDKPDFMTNPTSCAPTAIGGTLGAATGQSEAVSSRFQVGDCASLPLKPKLSLALSGKGQTTDGKHPAVTATLTQPAGQSNIKKVAVTLPLSLALDPDNAESDSLCEFTVGQKTIPECPASSIVGTATATTPVLDQPLTGPVYFVKNVRIDAKSGRQIKTLPTLAIPLRGQGVTLVLRASSAVVDDHLVTTVDNIPDASVSDFKLNINGGPKGILVVSDADICKGTQVADQAIVGQTGKTADDKITMSTPCGLAVVASTHTPTSLKLTVGGIGAGKLSVSGKGITKTSRTITTATTATLQPKLTKANRTSLAHHRNVKVRVTVAFTPKGAKKAQVVHKTLTIHGAKAPKHTKKKK